MPRGRDLHQALKTERVGEASGASVDFLLVKLQWSRDDIGFSLHANPRSWTSAGTQTTDLLRYLGFERQRCGLVGAECYARAVGEGVKLEAFAPAFAGSYQALQQSEQHLNACGYFFDQPEGWGFFGGRPGAARHRDHTSGDGHTGSDTERMKEAEDLGFSFVFSWMSGPEDKGWTIHCRPKHPPLSIGVTGVFEFLGLRRFEGCPHFDFEQCYWRFILYEQRGNSIFDGNAGAAHSWFDAHAEHFSPGVEMLLTANAAMEPFSMQLLPNVPGTAGRMKQVSVGGTLRLSGSTVMTKTETFPQVPGERAFEYDVAISFAGTEREHAEALATRVRDAGFNVFYDAFHPEHLWGKDLAVFFDDIFRKRSRYAIVFVSSEYANRMWTIQELSSALSRRVAEKGKEYILPVRVDDIDLPGLPPTLGYLTLSEHGIDEIADLLLKKLRG